MKVQCPQCGRSVVVNGLGRKTLNMPVIKVCDALQLHYSVVGAANELGCSRGYIYKVLKAEGLAARDVIKGKAAPR